MIMSLDDQNFCPSSFSITLWKKSWHSNSSLNKSWNVLAVTAFTDILIDFYYAVNNMDP